MHVLPGHVHLCVEPGDPGADVTIEETPLRSARMYVKVKCAGADVILSGDTVDVIQWFKATAMNFATAVGADAVAVAEQARLRLVEEA